MGKQFKCTQSWARNRKGDIVENYMYARYPKEIKMGNFEEIIPKKVNKPKKDHAPQSPKSTGGSKVPKTTSHSDQD